MVRDILVGSETPMIDFVNFKISRLNLLKVFVIGESCVHVFIEMNMYACLRTSSIVM